MVDFKNLRIDPQARANRDSEYAQTLAHEQERLADLEALEQNCDEPLTAWEQRFARDVIRTYRLFNCLTPAQWAKVDEILAEHEGVE